MADLSPAGRPKFAHPLKIGTRGSPLALAQTRKAVCRLEADHGLAAGKTEIVVIKTSGDMILDRPLAEAGGKGLFTRELDTALLNGGIDIAVHSAKDLPVALSQGVEIAGYLPREDARDAWISPLAPHPRELPRGCTVGTASLRRGAMVLRLRPDLKIALLRGNIETRLAKAGKGEFAATLLALAGLERLGLDDRVTAILDPQEFVPAPGQGAIALTVRAADRGMLHFLAPVLDPPTAVALSAERAFLRVLGASCQIPAGAYARLAGENLTIKAIVLSPDGSRFFESEVSGPASGAERIGETAAKDLAARMPAGFFDS
ncbi:MAG: hydroxymethylbilane synthase [Methylocapsa sp.]|nr:hydroxymethylbilane synthase [Methylocapsa sp.]